MIDMADTKPRDRSPEQIRDEIERTRADMDETIHQLSDRMRPGSVAGRLWERVKGDAGVGDVVREHPVPLALMGLGLGWLAIEEATGSSGPDRVTGSEQPASHETGAGEKAKGFASSAAEKTAGATKRTTETAKRASRSARSAGERATEGVRDAARTARDTTRRASEAAGRAGEETAKAAARAGEEVREGARKLRSGAAELAEDNPLALGAVAFGLGLLGGVLFPTSSAEDRAMGRTADRVKEEGGRLARETAEQAADVATETAEAASEELDRQLDERDATPGDVAEAAGEVTASAAEAAETSAREAGETIEREGRESARRTGETAREEAKKRTGDPETESGDA